MYGAGTQVVEPGRPIGLSKGECLVCVPVFGVPNLVLRAVDSVLRHTPPDVPVLIADDASSQEQFDLLVERVRRRQGGPRTVYVCRQSTNQGFTRNANDAMRCADPADVLLVNSDCVVAEGYYEGLRSAAHTSSIVATATALTNHGVYVSVPERNRPGDLPPGWTVDGMAQTVRAASLRLRPRIPTAAGHCVYIRRPAIELVGLFDEAFSPGYGEEVDFSQRCARMGLHHVVADDVFVFHAGSASFGAGAVENTLIADHERIISERYPHYHRWVARVARDPENSLARSVRAVTQSVAGLTVTIDGRCLGPLVLGTQRVVLELTRGLWERGGTSHIRLVVPASSGEHARRALAALRGVHLVSDVSAGQQPTDVVHRPYQVTDQSEFVALRSWGHRVVIGQLDSMAYSNPFYFAGFDEWERYAAASEIALAEADAVIACSRHGAEEAVAHGLVERERVTVIPLGVDHIAASIPPAPPTSRLSAIEGEEYVACVGTDYFHKNRPFAIKVVEELINRHGWEGRLLLAGPRVPVGSSVNEEETLLATVERLRGRVVRFDWTSESERTWILRHSSLVLYPSVDEGFGFLPFEAARIGTPCLYPAQGSLAEIDVGEARLPAWDAALAADAAFELMSSSSARAAHIDAISRRARELTWVNTARATLEVYREVARAPSRARRPVPASVRPQPEVLASSAEAIGDLPIEVREALRALAARPRLARTAFRGIVGGHRVVSSVLGVFRGRAT